MILPFHYPLKFSNYLRFKGHDMLAPFTAGWQSTDVNPLVIEKSEVLPIMYLSIKAT